MRVRVHWLRTGATTVLDVGSYTRLSTQELTATRAEVIGPGPASHVCKRRAHRA